MERADLIRSERANDRMQHATIMEQDEIFLFPVVRVHQLRARSRGSTKVVSGDERGEGREKKKLTLGAMAGRCILYSSSRTSLRSVRCAPSG